MSVKFTDLIQFPVLIFGLVGPIGVDLEYAQSSLSDELKSFNYTAETITITSIMDELQSNEKIAEADFFKIYHSKIDYANDIRKTYEANDILAALAISAIRKIHSKIEASAKDEGGQAKHGSAYIIRQLKTPDEIKLLRSVYGRQFIQVSVHGSPFKREDYLTTKAKIRSKGTLTEKVARGGAKALIERDRKEDLDYGQNISNAFPLGDVFIDPTDKESSNTSIERFLKALFGNNEVSPTREEYGMYLAKSASLRSSDLSRQVGAAIFSSSGEVISLGSNEVPRAGGGTYWTGDEDDSRDIREGHDPNELSKVEIFADIIKQIKKDNFLSDELASLQEPQAIVDKLLDPKNGPKYKNLRVMDLIEFGRIIHAEMSAICDAARVGSSVRSGVLYCTTFPCHLCAKHIVASGISVVVYLEPYPKSYAQQLHSDSIDVDSQKEFGKVRFKPFIGISPYRYRDLFEKGKRKSNLGEAKKWLFDPRRPMIDTVVPSHIEAEEYVIAVLGRLLDKVSVRSTHEEDVRDAVGAESPDATLVPPS